VDITSLSLCLFNCSSCMCDGCISKCWLCSVTSNLKLYHHYVNHNWHRCDGGIPSMDIIYSAQGFIQSSNQNLVGIGVMVVFLPWISSTIFKVLGKVVAKSNMYWWMYWIY
jgi:hypothetical protein